MKRMACAVALAAGSGLTGVAAMPAIAEPSPATAASGLQVSVVPPGTVSGDAAIPIDVKFHGGNIRLIELFVDGARLTKQPLSTRDGRGVVHFSLDPSLLSEGSHEVLIKAYEPDGTCATTTTQVTVAAGDTNALAHFEWPKKNAEVQGIVPIRVKIDPSITDPYVTYTVDHDFLAFRNYAPYVYNWDTAKAGNGVHTIGIEVMDGRTLQIVQKMILPINVKNIGGFTNVQPATTKNAHAETGSVTEAIEGVAESALPDSTLASRDNLLGLARSNAHALQPDMRHGTSPSGFRTNSALRHSSASRRAVSPMLDGALIVFPADPKAFVVTNTPLNHATGTLERSWKAIGAPDSHRPAVNPVIPHIAPGLAALAADPRDLMPDPAKTNFGLARQSAHFRRTGGVALRPSTVRHKVQTAVAPVGLPTFHTNKRRTFDVAFNNAIINFDVMPRIENGLPLAPFRAIFEHAGGTVKWYREAKVVRAFDNEREIEIKIGAKQAKVNNQPLSMEAVPYIDHGRTIVPISFIRDAMDLKVTFDEKSGHIMIEKK
jgi:hypothetical protein